MYAVIGSSNEKMADEDLADQLQLAREYSLLGNYETAMVYFDGVLATIQKQIRSSELSADQKKEWKQVKCLKSA